jgi:hypothetical protein
VLSQAHSLSLIRFAQHLFLIKRFMDFGLLGLSELIIVWSRNHPSKAKSDQGLSLSIAM